MDKGGPRPDKLFSISGFLQWSVTCQNIEVTEDFSTYFDAVQGFL